MRRASIVKAACGALRGKRLSHESFCKQLDQLRPRLAAPVQSHGGRTVLRRSWRLSNGIAEVHSLNRLHGSPGIRQGQPPGRSVGLNMIKRGAATARIATTMGVGLGRGFRSGSRRFQATITPELQGCDQGAHLRVTTANGCATARVRRSLRTGNTRGLRVDNDPSTDMLLEVTQSASIFTHVVACAHGDKPHRITCDIVAIQRLEPC